MKVRTGFISNSSSCSFIINRNSVPKEKVELIKQYVNCGDLDKCRESSTRCIGCRDDFWEYNDQCWGIEINDETISCQTSMANFDLYSYITRVLEINPRDIIVQEDEGINLWDYHSGSTFEEAKKRRDEQLNRMREFIASLKTKEGAE
ncbi:hypothetical protein [Treponema primitia]|uniref:hypothetical protein n=1 Tax=Treponema primitia TaxID=88058 RepID=UPI0002554DCF|nr:hypothetical protein [Treponema primitia]